MNRLELDHLEKLLDLLEVEREAEKEENKRALDRWPVEVRETLGKTVSRLSIEREDVGVGGIPLLVLSRPPAGEALSPFHNMDQGDLVRVTCGEAPPMDGTLYNVEDYRVTVALNMIPMEPPRGRCQIDLLGSDATYQRMRRALETALSAKGDRARLRDVLLGRRRPEAGPLPEIRFFDEGLNPYQRQAVRAALAAEDVALVHGPPGTGKTTVLVEIIRQAAARGLRVLASAPSNIAVDNLLEKLLETDLRLVRLGHPARTLENLRHATLMAQIADHPDQRHIRDLDDERERKAVQRSRRMERGGGIPQDEARALQKEIMALWREARSIERTLGRSIIRNAQIVLVTHGGMGKILGNEVFDLAVLDEASQASEPLSWIPAARCSKIVLAGDPLQLPPTIYSQKAAKGGLKITLMERLQEWLPEDLQTLLRIQYRMNEAIMGFSSERFYENRLEADPSVRDHVAAGLPGAVENELTKGPLVFVDTAGTGYQEVWNELLDSRENSGEAELAVRLLTDLEAAGLDPRDMAVITPYAAQARILKHLVPRGAEVGTVDGFQGREKEVVVVTLVRSNEKGEVGFLSDTRRMNVAMTRARRLLVVIGDSATIGQHPFYAAFLEYVERRGAYRSAYEWVKA